MTTETQNLTEERQPESSGLAERLPESRVDRFFLHLGTALFLGLCVLVLSQVLVRYFLAPAGILSIPWTEEIARYLLAFLTLFGAAVALARNEHIVITSLSERYPPKVQVVFSLVSIALLVAVVVVLAWGAWIMMHRMSGVPIGAVRDIMIGHVYGALFVALLLVGWYALRWFALRLGEAWRLFRGREGKV